jgi:putative colanic acid biosynthesis UDP-glucose lipid carrier transferase
MDNGTDVKQATKNDPRVTRFGAFIRRTSLDELPQFFNVLQGRMSIVGPRPHAVAHNEEYRAIVDRYMLRHKVKPGITGLAQISGYRGETDTVEKMEKRVEFDLRYIETWSTILDLKIIFLTVFKGFVGKAAY